MSLRHRSVLLDGLEHLEDAFGRTHEKPLERLGQAAALEGVATDSFAFSHETSGIEAQLYPRHSSIKDLRVAVDDLRGHPRAVLLHDLAARPREPAFEGALEARAVLEPEHALALRLAQAHLAFVLRAGGVEVGALPGERAALDVSL